MNKKIQSGNELSYGLLKHSQNNHGLVNIGDHIQSCAAEQFMPRIDRYVERDKLNCDINKPTKIILNGWFTDSPKNWPPNPKLIPLFISFHLQPKSAEIIFKKKENIDYLKKFSPIGCRDYQTIKLLNKVGISTYFSFCLTSTLGLKYSSKKRGDKIYLVDPLYSNDFRAISQLSLKSLITSPPIKKIHKLKEYLFPKRKIDGYLPQEIIKKGEMINHYVRANKSNKELYTLAKKYLKKYAKAKLVITSRIHCALPCLALNTPVLFLYDGLFDENQHMARLRGILDHMNILTTQNKDEINELFGKEMNVFHPKDIDWDNPPKNPASHKEFAKDLQARCENFIKN